MNKLLVFAFLLLICGQVQAQQKPQHSQYTLNNYLLNPAIAGIEDYGDLKVGGRYQWAGLEGAPVTYYTSFHTPLMKDVASIRRTGNGPVPKEASTKKANVYRRVRPHHGLGGLVMTTRTGPLKRSSLGFTYAYHQPISRTMRVSAGVSPGLVQYSLDQSYVTTGSPNDPAIADGRVNETKFDMNLGLWLYSRDFYLGVAGAQLVPGKREALLTNASENGGALQKHYYVTGGFRIDLSSDLAIIPSAMVKMAQPSPASVDVTGKLLYANRLWTGASYRHRESVSVMAGINVSPLLDVSYSYDASTSALGLASASSHEVVVGFKLRNTGKVLCPQWAW